MIRSVRARGAVVRGAAGAAALLLLLCCGGALAQDVPEGAAAGGAQGGTYLSIFWLAVLCVCAAAWLYMTAWVCDDAVGVGLRARLWTSILLGVGAVWIALAFLVHAAIALVTLPALGLAFTVYVRVRNESVPAQFRLFSKREPAAGKAEAGAATPSRLSGGHAAGGGARVEMQLLNEKGEQLSEFVQQHEDLAEAADTLGDIVALACNSRAWSVRIEPSPEGYEVLFNLDGVMQSVDTLEQRIGRLVIGCAARFLGITGKQRSQANMTAVLLGEQRVEVDVRGVKAPRGVAMVMSLPDWTDDVYRSGLTGLGMHQAMAERVARLANEGSHAIIISGPAASGRTSTFHALLGKIDIFTTDVATLESKIEHELDHVARHEVDVGAEAAFGKVFAAVLRDEPDVIGVDELTNLRMSGPLFEFVDGGKRVVATIQAASAGEAVVRLAQAVEPELLSHTLSCVLNQRLVRRLCTNCREPVEPNPRFLAKLRIDPQNPGTWYRATGCDQCLGAGYRGRIALFEMLILNEAVRTLITRGQASVNAVKKAAGARAIRSLYQDALLKVRQGITTLEEVRRALKSPQ